MCSPSLHRCHKNSSCVDLAARFHYFCCHSCLSWQRDRNRFEEETAITELCVACLSPTTTQRKRVDCLNYRECLEELRIVREIVPCRLSLLCGLGRETTFPRLNGVLWGGKRIGFLPDSGRSTEDIKLYTSGCCQNTYHCIWDEEKHSRGHCLVSETVTVADWAPYQVNGRNAMVSDFVVLLTGNKKRSAVSTGVDEWPLINPHYTLIKSSSVACVGHSAGAFTSVWQNFILSIPTSDSGPDVLASRGGRGLI